MNRLRSLLSVKNIKFKVIAILAFSIGQYSLYFMEANKMISLVFALCFIFSLVAFFAKVAGLGFSERLGSYGAVFIFRAITPISIGLFLMALYTWVQSDHSIYGAIVIDVEDKFHLERLYESISILYAVCTAFLLWKGLSDHDGLRHILKEEAGQIQGAIGYLNYLDGNENKKYAQEIRKSFKMYIERIIVDETVKAHNDNYQLLTDTRNYIAKLKPTTDDSNDSVAIAQIMRGLNNLFKVRMKRIACMETKLSPYILWALVLMSLSILYVTFATPTKDILVVKTTIFLLSGLMTFMVFMLLDINSPFAGYYTIKTDSFTQILKILEIEISSYEKDLKSVDSERNGVY